jgi:hypothetical protein
VCPCVEYLMRTSNELFSSFDGIDEALRARREQ